MRCPKEKRSIRRFMDQVRQRTKRTTPLGTEELIAGLNPLLRGWGEYYKRAHIRKLFQRLDGWIRRRIWSHRYRRWRNAGWKRLPASQLYGSTSFIRLLYLIPSLASMASLSLRESCLHEMCTGSLGGGRRASAKARLLRPEDYESISSRNNEHCRRKAALTSFHAIKLPTTILASQKIVPYVA